MPARRSVVHRDRASGCATALHAAGRWSLAQATLAGLVAAGTAVIVSDGSFRKDVMLVIHRRRVVGILCAALAGGPAQASAAPAEAAAKSARKARRAPVSAPAVDPLALAAAEREQLADRVAAMDSLQTVEASARWLSGQAWDTQDPWIHTMAARTWLKVQDLEQGPRSGRCSTPRRRSRWPTRRRCRDRGGRGRAGPRRFGGGAGDGGGAAGGDPAGHGGAAGRRFADRSRPARAVRGRGDDARGRDRRRTHARGSSYRRRYDETVDLIAGRAAVDLTSIHWLDIGAGGSITAGAVLASIGVAAGVPLLVLGAGICGSGGASARGRCA